MMFTPAMARQKFSDDVRAQKRDQILDAAMAVFEKEGGLEALSFRSLALELGLSYSAPYRYFASKQELVNAMRARAFRWIEKEMRDAIAATPQPEQQLGALSAAFIRSGLERPQRYALMFFNLDELEASRRSIELKAAKRDALDVCTQVIAAGQARGDFPDAIDALTASHLFWIGAHGLVSLQVAGQFIMGRDIELLIPTLIRTLRVGMENFATAPVLENKVVTKEKRHG
jgi:AcrR family transcriptional regulator